MELAEAWIDLVLRRADELRRAGVLAIGPASVTFAPYEPVIADDDVDLVPVDEDPANPWENPASYPTGRVPSIGKVDDGDKLPPIPMFDGDR